MEYNRLPIKPEKNLIDQYTHREQKRSNNPPVGLVTAETDHMNGKKTYQFDPHLDPQLQWAGKAEGLSFDVDTVSLHVHERIDPLTIIEAVRKKEKTEQKALFHWFETKENNPPIREAIEFYKHKQGWSNRLIAGDSLLVMNSLLEKEGMAGKIQMIYIDPPYGIKYGSNFQPFVNKRNVSDGKDEDLAQEPETIKAFRDTWELGIHSYLTYLRNRFMICHQLLNETGSIFVQISDENLHIVRLVLEEIFGSKNFISIISVVKTSGAFPKFLPTITDYLIWYGKDKEKMKYNQLFVERIADEHYNYVETTNKTLITLTKAQLEGRDPIPAGRRLQLADTSSQGGGGKGEKVEGYTFQSKTYFPTPGRQWSTSPEGMARLISANRLYPKGERLFYKRYITDFPFVRLTNLWSDTQMGGWAKEEHRIFVVQTATKIIERCILMSTDPRDIVLDPTCGSGTTAYSAEKWGRRWITCDTSRVAITLAKQRLMTALYHYYELAHPKEGISSGFEYEKTQHITLATIANNKTPEDEILYDHPIIDKSKKRISGPFTIEAVPSQRVKSLEDVENLEHSDINIARSGETLKQNDWIAELLSTGIRGKSGQFLEFARIEPLAGTRWIHAEAETKDRKKAVISFGPEYAPLEQRQVELAIDEAQQLVPKPKLVIFASFHFDPEAAKDIDELKWPGVDVLKAQMNTDLLTADLKKKRASNESFWLMGQPDVELKKKDSKYIITVNGFDYYNTKNGEIESGNVSNIAMWELDTDYDGRSLYPRQVFFPKSGEKEGWSKLSKTLKTQIDEDLIENYHGNTSLPFKLGENKQIAVKIIDDRGIESLKIIRVKE